MNEEYKVKFDASLIGMGIVQINPTQKIVRKAMVYMKEMAKIGVSESDLEKNTKEQDPHKILEFLDQSADFIDEIDNFVIEVLHPNKAQKNKFDNLAFQDGLNFAIALAQKILGMSGNQEGDQKSQ